MSDALTDLARDDRRAEYERRIFDIEVNKVLSCKATRADVEKLLELWAAWSMVPRGYWGASDPKVYEQRRALYAELLDKGRVVIRLCEPSRELEGGGNPEGSR